MYKMGLNELREKYLSFFEEKGHLRQESFPLIPQSDAGLLLINSGMAPLKPYFSGEVTPPRSRMTTCQKCIRTPDIERVGKTSRHGTFFEMLGNFSFGDYFKKEASAWAWEFCTEIMGLEPERLYVSVYLEDDEAWDIWTKEIGVEPGRMVRLGKADNFWEIGAGPCGPCSEIYYDRGAEKGCTNPECAPGCDCDRYVEFWNLVFTQFNNDGSGNYTPLKQKNIDTGMGLERLACIMQGVDNLFEVDTIRRVLDSAAGIAGVKYGAEEKTDISLRVITDHIRSTTMMVCDGILPSNEGRGYILRRLLRRAARHGRLLGINRPFLTELCTVVIEESGQAYPVLREKKLYIERVIRMEEERFGQTIDSGAKLLSEAIAKNEGSEFPAETAFKLYDTFGFPVDLTLEILEENALSLNRAAFDQHLLEQKERARAARAAMGDLGWVNLDLGIDRDWKTLFTGYNSFENRAKIWSVLTEGKSVCTAGDGQTAVIVLDKTPFYAESGGQVADTGIIENEQGRFIVTDVKKSNDGKFLHIGYVESGSLSAGEEVTALIDSDRRRAIMRAHSATHLLHKALRNIIGDYVEQAGSWVGPDMLRFDFTHFSALSVQEIVKINNEVNEAILRGLPISSAEMPMSEAKALGAMALFGEKYGDVVRVVSMGDYSVELCGGVHLDMTSKIGAFHFKSETSVAAGVRRIEARVGAGLREHFLKQEQQLFESAALFKTTPQELPERITASMEQLRALQRELSHIKQLSANQESQFLLESAQVFSGVRLVLMSKKNIEIERLRMMGDYLKDKADDVVAVLASVSEEKITFLSVCGKSAVSLGHKAGDLIKIATKICGGSGGGRPDSAMGGGKNASMIDSAFSAIVQRFSKID